MKGLRADAGFVGYYPAAKIIAGPGQQNGCAIRNLPKLDEKVALKGDLRAATLMRFSRDGKNVAVGIKSPETPELQIFNAERGELIRAHKLIASKVFATPTEVRTVAFSPDGTMIAAGTIEPKKIYVFDGNANELLAFDVKSAPDCLDFTPDNLFLAFKKSRNTVELISVKTKKTQRTFSDNPEGANGWCFSPDGAWIAIASGGHPQGSGKSPGKVRVFEVKTGKLVAVLD
jgi:WD40 repeat protein